MHLKTTFSIDFVGIAAAKAKGEENEESTGQSLGGELENGRLRNTVKLWDSCFLYFALCDLLRGDRGDPHRSGVEDETPNYLAPSVGPDRLAFTFGRFLKVTLDAFLDHFGEMAQLTRSTLVTVRANDECRYEVEPGSE